MNANSSDRSSQSTPTSTSAPEGAADFTADAPDWLAAAELRKFANSPAPSTEPPAAQAASDAPYRIIVVSKNDGGGTRERLWRSIESARSYFGESKEKRSEQDFVWSNDWCAVPVYLASTQSPTPAVGDWEIDNSTPSPILTYKKCSVIQDEQAHWALAIIRAALNVTDDMHNAYQKLRDAGESVTWWSFQSGWVAASTQSPTPAAASVKASGLYVEVHECNNCGHIGINDSDDSAACNTCDWIGPSPKEDKCPGCAQEGTMTSACPKCHERNHLIASTTLAAASEPRAPVLTDEQISVLRILRQSTVLTGFEKAALTVILAAASTATGGAT